MNNREFLSALPELIRARLPQELRGFETRQTGTLVKLYYWDLSVHYEVWLQRRTDRIEIGLHFEGEREENHWWLQRLAAHYEDIFQGVGPEIEAEEWTAKWTRLHQMMSLTPLDEQRLHEVARRMAQMIVVLHPLVSDSEEGVTG
jgi:hypothetical protein